MYATGGAGLGAIGAGEIVGTRQGTGWGGEVGGGGGLVVVVLTPTYNSMVRGANATGVIA